MKIKKGDKVKVLQGKDSGQSGPVEKVFLKDNLVLVGGLNVYKKHQKAKGQNQPGGIISVNRSFAVSKIALICPKCQKQTRVGYKTINKEKFRICKKCKAQI